MSFSIELQLEDGGVVTYDNVVSYTVEEGDSDVEVEEEDVLEEEPSPDEVPEDGDEEREAESEEG